VTETDTTKLGVISDTHGKFDPALHDVFAGVAHIVHAGDVGSRDVLLELATIAPVTAVGGNTDAWFGAEELAEEAVVEVAGHRLLVGHISAVLLGRHAPALEGFDAVITGHSHRYAMSRNDGVLYLNPGSAGAARFGLPRTVAVVELGGEGLTVMRVDLSAPAG
jgi:uncharacterized protein